MVQSPQTRGCIILQSPTPVKCAIISAFLSSLSSLNLSSQHRVVVKEPTVKVNFILALLRRSTPNNPCGAKGTRCTLLISGVAALPTIDSIPSLTHTSTRIPSSSGNQNKTSSHSAPATLPPQQPAWSLGVTETQAHHGAHL